MNDEMETAEEVIKQYWKASIGGMHIFALMYFVIVICYIQIFILHADTEHFQEEQSIFGICRRGEAADYFCSINGQEVNEEEFLEAMYGGKFK